MQSIFGAFNTNEQSTQSYPFTQTVYGVYIFIINNICDMCAEHIDFGTMAGSDIDEHGSIQFPLWKSKLTAISDSVRVRDSVSMKQ